MHFPFCFFACYFGAIISLCLLYFISGQDPPERPGVIKTEAIDNDKPYVNHNSIENDRANDVVINSISNQRPVIKREANPTNMSAGGLGGNKQNFSGFGRGFEQQASSENRAVKGVMPKNSSRDFKAETVCNEEFFDDDDDIIAAIADEDYFGSDEDFDMEQIDQLELGMENRSKTVMSRRTMICKVEKVENSDLEMLCDDDDIFEDDFITRDPQPEDADCFEIKPLHQRICDRLDTSGAKHQSKRVKISNSHSVESRYHSRITTYSTSHNHEIQNRTEPHVISKRPANLKAEPMIQMTNSSSGLIKTESSHKSNNSTTSKLSSANNTATSLFQASSLQMQHDGFEENISTATVAHASHPKHILDHCSYESSTFETEGNTVCCNSVPFQKISTPLPQKVFWFGPLSPFWKLQFRSILSF